MTRVVCGLWTLLCLGGCANTSATITGSDRSGSEQLLLTGSADRAIVCIDFRPLAGAKAYLDASQIKVADAGWVIFALRATMARQGLLPVDARTDGDVVVEAAFGAYGTDDADCRMTIPSVGFVSFNPSSSTPVALSRKNRQDAVVKLALAAYDVRSHRLV